MHTRTHTCTNASTLKSNTSPQPRPAKVKAAQAPSSKPRETSTYPTPCSSTCRPARSHRVFTSWAFSQKASHPDKYRFFFLCAPTGLSLPGPFPRKLVTLTTIASSFFVSSVFTPLAGLSPVRFCENLQNNRDMGVPFFSAPPRFSSFPGLLELAGSCSQVTSSSC